MIPTKFKWTGACLCALLFSDRRFKKVSAHEKVLFLQRRREVIPREICRGGQCLTQCQLCGKVAWVRALLGPHPGDHLVSSYLRLPEYSPPIKIIRKPEKTKFKMQCVREVLGRAVGSLSLEVGECGLELGA